MGRCRIAFAWPTLLLTFIAAPQSAGAVDQLEELRSQALGMVNQHGLLHAAGFSYSPCGLEHADQFFGNAPGIPIALELKVAAALGMVWEGGWLQNAGEAAHC